MNEQNVAALIAAIIILLVGFPIHEFSHAWTANRLGDSTARRTKAPAVAMIRFETGPAAATRASPR